MTSRQFSEFSAFFSIFVVGLLVAPLVPLFDFETFFYPAIRRAAMLRDPYVIDGFYNPPWTLIPLLPIGWFHMPAARSLFFGAMLAAFLYVPYRLGFKWWQILVFMLTPPVLACLWMGNLEWMVLLGLVVPAPFSTLLYLIKPQIGCVLALLDIFRGDHRAWSAFLPGLGLLAGLLLFPAWNTWPMSNPTAQNWSIWPVGVIFGAYFGIMGLVRKDKWDCLYASPFLSPYVLMYSWAGAMLALVRWIGGVRSAES